MASTKLLGFFLLPVYSCDFDPDLTLTLLSFIPSVPRDPVEGVHLMRGLRARTRGSRQVTRNPESRLPRAAEEELGSCEGTSGAPRVCGRGWKPRVGLRQLLTYIVSPMQGETMQKVPHSVPQFFPLEFQYGLWGGCPRDRSFAGLLSSRTSNLPGADPQRSAARARA